MAKAGTATELGTERIGKLLMQYAIPAIIAMTASSLYNMVCLSDWDKKTMIPPNIFWAMSSP